MKSYTKLVIIKVISYDYFLFFSNIDFFKEKMTKIRIVFFILFALQSFSQNEITIDAKILENGKKITVFEEITVKNTSNNTLSEIVLNDWNHAFSSKS